MVTPNRGIGPPWGAFCQISLTSCYQFLTDFQNSFADWKRSKFPRNPYNTSNHTFSMLPHYLAKVRSSDFGISGRKIERKCNMDWFLNTPNFNALNLPGYLTRPSLTVQWRVAWTSLCMCVGKRRTLWATIDRLCACVWAKGGHFEQLLTIFVHVCGQYWAERRFSYCQIDTIFRWLFGNYHKLELLNFGT